MQVTGAGDFEIHNFTNCQGKYVQLSLQPNVFYQRKEEKKVCVKIMSKWQQKIILLIAPAENTLIPQSHKHWWVGYHPPKVTKE